MLRRLLAPLVLTLVVAHPSAAHAQDNSATVEALFDAGKKLVADGKLAEACPKFLASYNLEHRVGTLVNLADCYERNSQLASAWGRFVEAATLAQRANQPERAAFASEHATGLQGRLSTLAVSVPSPSPGQIVTRDDISVDGAAYGVAVPVDGGKHLVTSSAPGRKPWQGEVLVSTEGDHQSITVPELEPLAPLPPLATTVIPPLPNKSSPRRTAALVTGGAGVVALMVGIGTGIAAIAKKNSSNVSDCGAGAGGAGTSDPNACNAAGASLRSAAVLDGDISTIFFGIGAAALVGGVVLWVTAPSASASAPAATVGFDGRSVVLSGRF